MTRFSVVSAQEIIEDIQAAREQSPHIPEQLVLGRLSQCSEADAHRVLRFATDNGILNADWTAKLRGDPPENSLDAMWTEPRTSTEMIWIPPGPFLLGAARTLHFCEGFYLATHPVTNGQFRKFLSISEYEPTDENASDFFNHWRAWRDYRATQNHPATWVSMIDAMHYCHWAGFDLPTQWLWEKAARGPDGKRFPWGDQTPDSPSNIANLYSDATRPVGDYAHVRSHFGCQDLVGNVSEWCHVGDPIHPGRFPTRPIIAAVADIEKQPSAVRGACFLRRSPQRFVAWHARMLAATRRNRWTGFRVAFFPVRAEQSRWSSTDQ